MELVGFGFFSFESKFSKWQTERLARNLSQLRQLLTIINVINHSWRLKDFEGYDCGICFSSGTTVDYFKPHIWKPSPIALSRPLRAFAWFLNTISHKKIAILHMVSGTARFCSHP